MRYRTNRWGVAGVIAAVVFGGCQGPINSPDGRRPIRTEAEAEAFLAERHARMAAERSDQEAERLLDAMQRSGSPIQWQDIPPPPVERPELAVLPPREEGTSQMPPATEQDATPPAPPEDVRAPASGAQPQPSREELLAELRRELIGERYGSLTPALGEAFWSLFAGKKGLDEAALAGLNAEQRQQVERFHRLLELAEQRLLAGSFHREELLRQMDQIFGSPPLAIRQVVLCRNVQGYGVFDPFPSTTFLAGRSHRMILYIELDHFQHQAVGPEFEVRLNQEVVLYNDADGLAVWRHEPVEVVDRSRNRRRDFFVVQIINLPARLGVGKYQLTVSVADKHGGSMDERRIELEMVADEKLVRSAEASAEQRWQLLRDLLGAGGDEETGKALHPR